MRSIVARSVRMIFISAISLCSNTIVGQDVLFRQLTTSYTNCVMRDQVGFIWIGTQDGLLRYDGYEYRTFRNRPGDALSISNNFVWCLQQDSESRIWIGTFGGGLGMWDPYTETFSTFYCEPPGTSSIQANTIRALAITGDSLLLVGTEKGIRGFDLGRLEFHTGGVWDTLSGLDWFTYAIAQTGDGTIYVGTESGLYGVANIGGPTTIQRLDLPGGNAQTIPAVLADNGSLYVGSEHGLYVSSDTRHFEAHMARYSQQPTRVQQVFIDANDDIWLATQRGLAHFNTQRGYHWYRGDQAREGSLKTDFIHCIGEAEDGILLAGTRQGVHQFSISPPLFQSLNPLYENTGCSRIALGMTEDHNKNIWVCSRGGLVKIETTGEVSDWKLKCYLPENSPGMREAYTINITRDTNDDLWVAHRYNGFSKSRLNGEEIVWSYFPRTVSLFGGEGVNQVYQDATGEYWIATRGFGLMQFFPDHDSVRVFGSEHGLSHPYIFRIYEDRKDRMWIATANGGLCAFDRKAERFTCYVNDRSNPNSLSSNMVLAVSEDSKGKLWVCTVDGLNIMEDDSGMFSVLTTMDGLPNDVVYAAIEDSSGRTWLSTNEGIVRMQFPVGSNTLDVFDVRDGIPGQEFNQHAFLKHSSGLFLFGSIEGVTVWNPGSIRSAAYHPKVVLTDILLFNESIPVGREKKKRPYTLDVNVNDVEKITLAYDQNSLAFKFTALGYAHSKIGTYMYQMEGIDDDWIRSGDRRFASYPGLSPGSYRFKVNVCNRDGDCNPDIKTLDIDILPPPWRTWWAYLIYTALILSAVGFLLWMQAERSRAIENAKAMERDRFRKKMARDFHDEAGNKITLLSLLTDRARKKSASNPEVTDLLHDLQNQIQELRSGMRDFIWIMDPSRDTLFDTVVRFRDFAEKLCEQAEIDFQERGRTETLRDIIMPGNVRRHFLLIFKEAINNSLKYAKAGEILFAVSRNADQVWEFALHDYGLGFDPSATTDGNGLKNMKARAAQINAEITIHSTIGKGTIITLRWDPESMPAIVGN